MSVIYSDKAMQWGEGFVLLQEATSHLEELLEPSVGQVNVEWDRAENAKGQPAYTLRLSDGAGSVSASFALDELKSPSHMRVLLVRLLGRLLQVRSHKLLREMAESRD